MAFDKRVLVILGATGEVGGELCRRLSAQGAKLIIAGRNPEKLNELADEIKAQPYLLDAAVSEDVTQAIGEAAVLHGRLDGVANCVSAPLVKPAHETSDVEWEETLGVNLGSAFHAVRAAARYMRAQDGGSIVLVSTAVRDGLAGCEAAAAAEAGVIGLTLSAAATYASRKIRVNCVAPGLPGTPLAAHFGSPEPSPELARLRRAAGPQGSASEIAGVIEYLLDPDGGWITGQVVGWSGIPYGNR
jgi:NAD(P)-dependent dehydrogenase (short-subunit alcohol dehydrogenase family)